MDGREKKKVEMRIYRTGDMGLGKWPQKDNGQREETDPDLWLMPYP